MRHLIRLCGLAALLAGCASADLGAVAFRPRPALPLHQVEMIPADRHPDLTGVVEIEPSYGHWGLTGWILYLQPRAATTPGLCDLPLRYVEAAGMRALRPNDPDEVKTGLRWAVLDQPLSGPPQDEACRDLDHPSRNIPWFNPDGEFHIAAGATVLRDVVRSAARNDARFRAAVACRARTCTRQQAQIRKIRPDMVIGMTRSPPSETTPYAIWNFRLDERAIAEAGLDWLDTPLGIPTLVVPEIPATGRRTMLIRYPGW